MKKVLFLFIFLSSLYFTSCGSKENPYDREQKEIDKEISASELQVYKSFKVALRGTAQAGKDPEFDKARAQIFSAMAYTIGGINDSSSSINPIELFKTSKALTNSIELLSKTDEDSLPTILENILLVIQAEPELKKDLRQAWIPNESEEHGILSVLWLGTPSAPSGLTLYELSRVNENDLRSVDVRIISKMTRAIFYLQNKWPCHSEKSADELISLIEKEKNYLVANPWPLVDVNGKAVTPEQAWHQLHALAIGMRGLARMEMDSKKTEATDDLEAFVKEAKQAGFDDPAMNDLENKIAILKCTSDYFGKIALNSKPIAGMRSSNAGRQFLHITDLHFGDLISDSKNKVDSALNKLKNVF